MGKSADGAVTLETTSGVVPLLVSVTVCAADVAPTVVDGKAREVGDTVIWALFTPLPVSATDNAALPVPYGIVSVPLREPA